MRYVIDTKDDEMQIGAYLARQEKEGKLRLIEKGNPLEVLKAQQHKIQRALDLLKKAGIDREVLIAFIQAKLPSSMGRIRSRRTIEAVLDKQEDFYKAIGITFR